MEFNISTQVFGINRVTIDGNTFCSVFTGQPSSDPSTVRGLEVTRLSADPVVFDQLPSDFTPGDKVEFLAKLNRAAGGKAQPYLTGVVVVTPQATPTAPQPKQPASKS